MDGAVSLCGMLNIPSKMRLLINDYKMYLVEARQNKLIFHNHNNRDLSNLLGIILDRSISKNEAKKKAIEYSEEHKTDKSVIMTVAGATNTKLNYHALGKGEMTMCTLFEEIAKESKNEGVQEGLKEGIKEATVLSISNLMESTGWSMQEVMNALKIPKAEQEKYIEILKEKK